MERSILPLMGKRTSGYFFLFPYIYILNQCVVASHSPRAGDPVHNPGMCPAWEPNQCPFGLQASAQSTEPHHPGPFSIFLKEEQPLKEES